MIILPTCHLVLSLGDEFHSEHRSQLRSVLLIMPMWGVYELLQAGFSSRGQRQKDPAPGYFSRVHSVQSYGALISTTDLITF